MNNCYLFVKVIFIVISHIPVLFQDRALILFIDLCKVMLLRSRLCFPISLPKTKCHRRKVQENTKTRYLQSTTVTWLHNNRNYHQLTYSLHRSSDLSHTKVNFDLSVNEESSKRADSPILCPMIENRFH